MPNPNLAQLILSLATTPDRAASTVGDLFEESAAGSVWPASRWRSCSPRFRPGVAASRLCPAASRLWQSSPSFPRR